MPTACQRHPDLMERESSFSLAAGPPGPARRPPGGAGRWPGAGSCPRRSAHRPCAAAPPASCAPPPPCPASGAPGGPWRAPRPDAADPQPAGRRCPVLSGPSVRAASGATSACPGCHVALRPGTPLAGFAGAVGAGMRQGRGSSALPRRTHDDPRRGGDCRLQCGRRWVPQDRVAADAG